MERGPDYAAALLADAHATGDRLKALPEDVRPRTYRQAYAIQKKFVDATGIETAGWKIGCTSERVRRLLGAKEPFAGRVFAPRCFPSGVRIPSESYPTRGLEGEFAFVMGKNVKPRKRPYTRADMLKAVDELRPAIEIIDTRYDDWRAVTLPELVADLGMNAAIVYGEPVKGWRRRNLGEVVVTMRAGGKVVGKGTGADVYGHPLDALAWLANNPPTKEGLQEGEIVLTGTCTGFHEAAKGVRVSCDYGWMGKIGFSFV